MLHPLKITSTLADETRFQIYEYMLQQKKTFTVQDIADKFKIHPNVARLHLTKLAEINLITADFLKSGKGGRPGRIYKVSEQGVELSFPKREDKHLIKWAIELVYELGPEALEKAKKISYEDGFKEMRNRLAKMNSPINFEEKLEILSEAALLIGYIPKVVDTEKGKKVILTIYNCPFRSQIAEHSDIICDLHQSYIKGQIDALFEENSFVQFESMIHDCEFCKYEIDVPNVAL
ncbi:helix-turn-helix domain-containing protein [Ureibacillus sp. FSL K6-8385]|uniref:Transcriptional regulator n=1 Tax=Ureibacillus terrenus TaxID=118246 RepID=A0A540V683_9BACL|nr:helix-turn-helix domain-containing protein [Ureibacillus terrenus]MED3660737.1 transcriptional regulator [Ureibacillus terrenus]MED3762924.1 transcriptional regulator [Ureibacillus terrenus]TQE92274.1 transcriptional regulator [Ureibacillus terrenus]